MRDERASVSTCERRLLNVLEGEPRGRQAVKLLTTGEGPGVGGVSQCDTEGTTTRLENTLAPGHVGSSVFVVLLVPLCFTAAFRKTAKLFLTRGQ